MARRRRTTRTASDGSILTEVGGATLRLSHRVPLIGVVFAVLCAIGWWYLRQRPDAVWGAARVLSMVLAVLAGLFALVAVIGLLRNLFPQAEEGDARPTRRR